LPRGRRGGSLIHSGNPAIAVDARVVNYPCDAGNSSLAVKRGGRRRDRSSIRIGVGLPAIAATLNSRACSPRMRRIRIPEWKLCRLKLPKS
jgi:hypothetical protein